MRRDHLVITFLAAILVVSTIPGGPAGVADAAIIQPSFTRYAGPAGLPDVQWAGEPSVGVNWNTNVANGGTVMYQAYRATYRVTFDDATSPPTATWENAKSPYSIINVDPIAAVDHVTGRTFAGGLDGACSVLSYSDNDGASWTPMGNSCAGAAWDHPTIGSGPWAGGKPLNALYDRVVYYCAQLSVAQCAVSSDGGLTFGAGINVPCGYINPGLHGSVHVGSNGWAYLPFLDCGGNSGVAVTKDNGLTWQSRPITNAKTPGDGFDPDVATTTSGWAYVAYPTADWGVGVALTKDGGATWTNFGDVAAAAGIRSSTFHEMVAGDDDRAAVVYLGSTTDGKPHASSFNGVWHTYVT
ncbi:MAG TPA: sialidase family protein, partial [Candidatus Thermoplasmatota archaeon]|nr:sialidase family protein [Candidatus Thermoplasmatota archaeon]